MLAYLTLVSLGNPYFYFVIFSNIIFIYIFASSKSHVNHKATFCNSITYMPVKRHCNYHSFIEKKGQVVQYLLINALLYICKFKFEYDYGTRQPYFWCNTRCNYTTSNNKHMYIWFDDWLLLGRVNGWNHVY